MHVINSIGANVKNLFKNRCSESSPLLSIITLAIKVVP